jgi:hypothetical protein
VCVWCRLRRKRELDTEAYKICQNRTICELVRRRRNDPAFGADDPASPAFSGQLLEVWGIGAAKVATYCPEMIAVPAGACTHPARRACVTRIPLYRCSMSAARWRSYACPTPPLPPPLDLSLLCRRLLRC